MQGLADGYFVVPATIAAHLAARPLPAVGADHPNFRDAEAAAGERTRRLLSVRGRRSPDSLHRELGLTMWDHCGMSRNRAGLESALAKVRGLRAEFWENVRVTGDGDELNSALEHAGRVADFLEFAELLAADALHREESCGGHFREEHQTSDGEAKRDDTNFSYVAAWEFAGLDRHEVLHKEPLQFEVVKPSTRSYQ
jgi:succinate dehydrogenase / fumarate reductase flavoprotein subunit